jgi:hypothetical protein
MGSGGGPRNGVSRLLPMYWKRSFIAILLAGAPFGAFAFDGPLQVRNQFPLLLTLSPPYLESAGVRDSISVGLNHSSVYVIETSQEWTFNTDLELTELDLRLRKKLGDRTELGLHVPVLRPTAGFLDGPLASFHDALGTGDYGRSARPENSFLYTITYQGKPVVQGVNDRTGIGDVGVTLKRQLRAASPVVSVMAEIEVPTGDARTGYGNGSYDFGIALLSEWDMSAAYRGYAMIGMVAPGDLKGYQTIPLRLFGYAGLGVEAAWWEHFHVLVQTVVASSPLPETGIRQLDWPGILLTFGGRYSFDRSSIEFSLTEDPNTAGAPDFIANVGWTMKF